MALKLDGMSPKELDALIREAQGRMASARATQIASVREKIQALLNAGGLQLIDVFPLRGAKTAKRAGAGMPKYHNPANPAQTWTGHGMKPAWFVAALKRAGGVDASLLIAGGSSAKPPRAALKKAAKAAPAKRAAKKSPK